MAKRENRRSDYSAELRGHSVYDNRLKYMDCNLNQMSQSVYFEFQPRDQVYSYALETNLHGNASDGSNGTVSTYAESSVGPLKNNNSPNNYFHSRNTKQVPTTEQRQGEQNRVSATEQYVSGQGLRDSTQSTGTTYDRINETDINVQVDRRINKHGNTKTQSCALGRVLLILITIIVLLGAGVVLVYVFVINRNNAAQSSDCDTLPQVPNGQSRESISDQGYTTATVRCSHGYELHGNETMTCTEGSWSVKPTCERIQCGPFPEVENGKVNGTDTAFESTASITCNPGFLVEESTITCSGDANWSPPTGCYEHPCGIYTPFDDMMVVEELTLSKMTLCLTCKPGLMFVNGSDQCVTCQNGKWTGSPECEIPASDCDTLPQVPNSQSRESISDQGYTTATVRCSHGYELHGNETMSCTEGSWSVKPTCERIQCGPFPEVENGKVNGTDTAFESTASITCNPGFLVEESTITCSGDGNWSPPTGCYEHPCGIYTPFDDMMVVEELTLSKMTLCLTCKPGLMFVNGSDQCVTCQNGKWTGSPECEIPASDCDTLPQVPNGQSRESISDQGYTTATVRCSHGYELHGNETMTCKEGSWSVKPTCERIQCEPFPEVENGKVNGTDTAFESTASITCTPGFLVEESTITCSGDGNWSPPTGCYEHPCGIYTPFDDMMVVEELTLSKMTLCLTCKPGLMFVNGSDQCVTCQNGKWTGSPECEIPASDCDTLPQVPNGQSRESISDQGYTTATVRCSHGYELHGNETMSCTEGSWSVKPTCERIQCGPFPEVENGKVNGTDTAFESTASITCNPGFLVEESTITCSGDGNWSPPTGCYEHPCGIYTPFDDMMVVEELTLSKMTLCLTCKPGLMFVNGSDQCVTCQNGKWTGSPECEIPGMVYFDPPKPMYHVDDRVSLTCVVQGSQEWQSIMVAKTNFQSSNTEPLIFLNRTRDEMLIQSLGDTDRSSVSHQITSDGVEVDFEIANALCEDGGVYICGNVVGTVDSPDKVKSTNTSVHIIDVTSSVPEVIVPETMHVGIEDKIKCTSEIGQDENGTVLGEIVFQIKYKNTDSFKNLSSVTEDSLSQKSNCRLNETIVSTFIPENDMHEALVRCVVLTTDGIQLTSTVETLKIVSPRVNISALPHVFTFGETAVITGVMDNIYGWDLIEVRRKCSNTEEYIARITADAQGEPILTDNHVRLTEKDVTSSSARVELKFDSVKCGDSCGSAEETAEYSAAVRINNDTWIERETKIKFQRQPDIPYLDIPYDVISGNTARFECMGEIGDPKGYLEIESTFEDTNFTVFLSSKEGKDSNAFGSITSVTDVNEECSNVRTIAFQIHSLTSKFHQKKMRCVSRPSLLLVNGQSAVSDIKAIEVIPENYCSKPDSYTGARRHPFHCSMFVSCHNGHVTGVPAGCQEVECFQDTACYSCEDIGGCSITDIYVDSFSNWIQLGDSVTLICKVKDFQGLTDIIIYKNHNETVTSSFLGGDFEAGVTKVQDESYISGNNGQLTVFIASVQCKDKGAYRCVPNGTGKHSEDETNLAVRDVDGNTVC